MPLPFTGESYFDYPDGTEIGKKLWITIKNAGLVSACVATIDVLLYSHPKGYAATLGRIASVCAPIIGISTTFVVFTNSAANFRKKDDHINWMIGGCAAGIVCGAWKRSGMVGFCTSLLFATAGYVKKDALMNNFALFERESKIQNGGIWSPHRDWTLTAHRPGNWTTGK
ncbi:hypothetical protein PPYR_09738 [Photinus pyralis]|uniref:NADH dehydrogenase [ubiquinone] 1 alpha subcomplex subunit 11 n=1 Tax=Photinus pyralis TaxID=7054 RepID=A0A1Y1M584_PHOPY|nr:hypothetical protein PPYR_09738 [Photinus pyralis]